MCLGCLTDFTGVFIVVLTVMQTRQPIFIKLLQSTYRVIQCPWLSGQQKFHVENCLRSLTDTGDCLSHIYVFFYNDVIFGDAVGGSPQILFAREHTAGL